MRLRGWASFISIMLCLSLDTGCGHLQAPAVHADPLLAADTPPPPTEPSLAPASPYHPVAVTSERKTTAASGAQARIDPGSPNDSQVERAHYPSSAGELIPEPKPPAPAAAPAPADPSPAVKLVATSPKLPEDPPLIAALRYCLNKQPAEAVACLKPYGKPAQELLLCLLPLIVHLTEQHELRDPQQVDAIMDQLALARDSLRLYAPLKIGKMSLASSIQGFGVYQALPEDQTLHPGLFVRVYAEFQNFTTRRDGNLYAICLRSKMEICDFRGKSCWRHDFRDPPDISTTSRNDFFESYDLYVPDLPPGYYTLRLQVSDVPTQRSVTRTLDFRVAPSRTVRGNMTEEATR